MYGCGAGCPRRRRSLPGAPRIALAVTDPTTRIADDTLYQLALLPGEPVESIRVADEAAALDRIQVVRGTVRSSSPDPAPPTCC